MADHAHKQIRGAIVTALTGLTTSGSRVYANRLYPLSDTDVPALRIYLDEEEASAQTIHLPMTLERTVRLVVECVAKATSALDDTVDLMSKEVEIALAAGVTVSGVLLVPVYSGSEFDDEISDKPVAAKRLRFDLTFYTLSNAPDDLI